MPRMAVLYVRRILLLRLPLRVYLCFVLGACALATCGVVLYPVIRPFFEDKPVMKRSNLPPADHDESSTKPSPLAVTERFITRIIEIIKSNLPPADRDESPTKPSPLAVTERFVPTTISEIIKSNLPPADRDESPTKPSPLAVTERFVPTTISEIIKSNLPPADRDESPTKPSPLAVTERFVPTTISEKVKKRHAQGVELPLEMCAVPVEDNLISDVSEGCKLAEFDPFDSSILQFIKKPSPLQCRGEQLTKYRNGAIEFLSKTAQNSKVMSAAYSPIFRLPEKDWGFKIAENKSLDLNQKLNPVKEEFVRVETKTQDGKIHTDFHAAVVPKQDVLARPRSNAGLPVNVMMIGFDSLSRAHFQRAFPGVFEYLEKDLSSVFMKGYSIVGDGTTPALTAFLTGLFEQELPEARRGYKDSEPVDRWPWIFANYKSAGYATLFSEDCPSYAAFNYRLHGFNKPPTDHFSRYFWEAATLTSPYCIHSKPQHRVHFDYVESFFEAYPTTPKFGLSFLTDISHNSLNSIYLCADDFLQLLKNLHQENRLNDTILVVFGDHGFRYGESRATLQGRLEERLPLLSFAFPYWFEAEYPEILENLRHNSEVVTSPFDLHATLQHILKYPEPPSKLKRGSSMFTKISKSRDCQTAGVAEHYCPCLNLKPADPKHEHIKRSAQVVIEQINNLTSSDNKSAALCHRLKINKILSSHQQIANTKFQKFLGSADIHGRKPKFAEGKVKSGECNYHIQIQTSPGDGLFDAPVRFIDGQFRVTGDISRINMYGVQPRCILSTRPDLRKYCLCKDYVPTKTNPDT